MMKYIDSILNKVTMYRLVLYYLIALVLAAFVFGFFGLMPNTPIDLAFSTLVIGIASWTTNWIFSKVFKVHTNIESVYITALILALIITPVSFSDFSGIGFLIFVSVWAMASKYIFTIHKRHIFNPVAFAVVLTALTLNHPATWWVGGNAILLPIVVIGGLLIVRKVRQFPLVISFVLVALLTSVLMSTGSSTTVILQTVLHSAMFFLGFVMLTEPLTAPPRLISRIFYGAIVGFLFVPAIHVGSFYFTPEIGLLVGNIFAYLWSSKRRNILTLVNVEKVAKDVYNFVFKPDTPLLFHPGQYLEWTIGHARHDNRGNRRYFTIASAPTEKNIHLGVKFYNPPSTFKKKLAGMKIGDTLSTSNLAGDFILPRNKKTKAVFISGGIGVTPFRSMVQHLLNTKEVRDIVILYANRTLEDIAYKDIFDRAYTELGIRTVHILSDEKQPLQQGMYSGFLDAELIKKEIPDYLERTFYISGPHGMVQVFEKTLAKMGVSRFKIKSDFFPGFA